MTLEPKIKNYVKKLLNMIEILEKCVSNSMINNKSKINQRWVELVKVSWIEEDQVLVVNKDKLELLLVTVLTTSIKRLNMMFVKLLLKISKIKKDK